MLEMKQACKTQSELLTTPHCGDIAFQKGLLPWAPKHHLFRLARLLFSIAPSCRSLNPGKLVYENAQKLTRPPTPRILQTASKHPRKPLISPKKALFGPYGPPPPPPKSMKPLPPAGGCRSVPHTGTLLVPHAAAVGSCRRPGGWVWGLGL